jgi:hypothetical protein
MASQDLNSNNIDAFDAFDFRTLNEDDEIEVSEQDYRSFPLSIISQRNGILNVNVILEVYKWDYWLRNYSIDKFKSAFEKSFSGLLINGISEVMFQEITEEEGDEYILLSWNLKFPTPRSNKEIKTKILNSVDVILYKTRIQLEDNKNINSSKRFKKFFRIDGSIYHIGAGIFWVALPIICGFAFFLGTIKYDAEKISLADEKKRYKTLLEFGKVQLNIYGVIRILL